MFYLLTRSGDAVYVSKLSLLLLILDLGQLGKVHVRGVCLKMESEIRLHTRRRTFCTA